MKLPLFQVDAFTSRVFGGNPAAVCPLRSWLDDGVLQAIAAENNLSETAFFVAQKEAYQIRWMTPKQEVDLCGHATLASAYVIFNFIDQARQLVTFSSKSGPLQVARAGDLLVLDFPAWPIEPIDPPPGLVEALRVPPKECWSAGRDYLVLYETEAEVRALDPDMAGLLTLDRLGVIATAPGQRSDFVSRFFAPRAGIPEDPVTGSAHCALTPFWHKRLGKARLHALQVSARGGELFCMPRGDRVAIAGRAAKYFQGVIEL